ncbi:eCIS core domain-containing protein [Longimicrobium sp.]|uniref:eCIS core domain-containing protein n=1 Tax=Longimicrobium sp. TaxID=2029185 RepID=UPI002D7E3C67|nr:DUF4157 domain-containing protein [Longimicrobium sp.]
MMKTPLQKKAVAPAPPIPSPLVSPRRSLAAEAPGGTASAAPAAGGHDFAAVPVHPPSGHAVRETAQAGLRGTGAPLPHGEAIQRAFGRHDLSSVRAHVGGEAAAAAGSIGARAYASGGRVAFRESPTLRTAAHEAAHVVQQRGEIGFADGIGRAGDRHERHADAVAERVEQGRSAEPLLDAYAPRAAAAASSPSPGAVQMQDEPTLTPYKKKGVIDQYAFTEKKGQKPTWIEAYKIGFLGDAGWDAFLWAKGKGYSTFAGVFIMAQGSLESDFAKGNGGEVYHNMFSLMGGPKGNIGTAHGNLQKFPSWAEGLEAYTKTLGANFSGMVAAGTGLYLQDSFTPDDVNKAFHQYNYYAPPVYLGDKTTDYGRDIFRRIGFIAGPLLAVVKQKISALGDEWNMAYQQSSSPDEADAEYWQGQTSILREEFKALNNYYTEIETARTTAATKLTEHEALKAAGKIKPKP